MNHEFCDFWDEREMALRKEDLEVQILFRYQITVGSSSMYCNELTIEHLDGGRTRLVLQDVWVNDVMLIRRLVPQIEIMAREYQILELARDPATVSS